MRHQELWDGSRWSERCAVRVSDKVCPKAIANADLKPKAADRREAHCR